MSEAEDFWTYLVELKRTAVHILDGASHREHTETEYVVCLDTHQSLLDAGEAVGKDVIQIADDLAAELLLPQLRVEALQREEGTLLREEGGVTNVGWI